MNNKQKITLIFLIGFSLVDLYLMYHVIGYIILGLNVPLMYSTTNNSSESFIGMYVSSAIFFILLIISLAFTITSLILFLKFRKESQ